MKKGIKRTLIAALCIATVTAAIATGCGAKKETAPAETQATQMAGMANPWSDVSEQELNEKTGMSFKVPEGAQNVVYRVLEEEKLAETQFDLDGMHFTARAKGTAGIEDISGYQGLEVEDAGKVADSTQTFLMSDSNGEDQVYLHYDVVPGVMQSLTVHASHIDEKFDIEELAATVFPALQGEVG